MKKEEPKLALPKKKRQLSTLGKRRKEIDRVWKLFERGKIGWMQGDLSINKDGKPEDVWSKDVCRMCITGAIHRIYGKPASPGMSMFFISRNKEPEEIIKKLETHLNVSALWRWNDRQFRRVGEIIAVCKELDI